MSTSKIVVTCADVCDRSHHVLGDRLPHHGHRLVDLLPRRAAAVGASGRAALARLRRGGARTTGRLGCRRAEAAQARPATGGGAGAASGTAAGASSTPQPVWLLRLDEVEDVLLRHPAAPSGARNVRDVDAVLGRDPGDDRGDEGASVAVARRSSSAERCRLRPGPEARSAPARAGAPRSARRSRRRSPPPRPLASPARAPPRPERRAAAPPRPPPPALPRARSSRDRADGHRLALLGEDPSEHALGGARHLGVDLVGRDLEQGSSAAIGSPSAFSHFVIVPFGDGDAHLGHHDVDSGPGGHAAS